MGDLRSCGQRRARLTPRVRRGRLFLVAVVLVAAVGGIGAWATTPASAATVRQEGSLVLFDAAAGEQNSITIELQTGSYVISDGTASLTAGLNCSQLAANRASCPALPFVVALTRDGDDEARMLSPFGLVRLCGGPGADRLTRESGDAQAQLFGEEGDDVLSGGSGTDAIDGEADCDGQAAPALPGRNTVTGGAGNDLISGGPGADTVDGGEGDDTVFGLGGHDTLDGGPGMDVVAGDEGDDVLGGGADADILNGGDGGDVLAGGGGDDELSLTLNVRDVLISDSGDDLLDGGPGDDILNGGPGASVLMRDATAVLEPDTALTNGADRLRGGEGRDTATYVKRTSAVAASLDGQPNDGAAGEGDAIESDVEVLAGGSGDDALAGGGGAVRLEGGPGADVVEGAAGNDELFGGGGSDTVSGAGGADTLRGNEDDDSLKGGAGDDVIGGGSGNDTIAGEDGKDELEGGTGLDRLLGGAGADRLEGAAAGLVGADGADSLAGGPGGDSLKGGPGDDLLEGGSGRDGLAGGPGEDKADYRTRSGAVVVTLDGRANDGGRGERDNIAADVEGVLGGRGADTFLGRGVANTLEGAAGADVLDGRGGQDSLRGAAGGDLIRSRDRAPDRVRCGAGRDFAVADELDSVSDDCELVDLRRGHRPRAGRSFVVRATRAGPRFRPRGMRRLAPLRDVLSLPVRSTLGVARGRVRMDYARRGHGPAVGRFAGAAFTFDQRGVRGAAELRLRGGRARSCRGRGRATSRRVRAFSARVRGGTFRVRARHATITARDARWRIVDRCDSTLVSVRSGTVSVSTRDGGRRLLMPGERHLAKSGR